MSRHSPHAPTLLLFTIAAICPLSLPAQGTTAHISVAGGVATDQQGVRSSALTVAPGISWAARSVAAHVGGSVTRFANDARSLGAGTSLVLQDNIGRHAALTLSGNAGVSRLSSASTATFSSADLMPALELRAGPLNVFGGVRAAAGSAAQRGGPGLPFPGSGADARVSRLGAGLAYGGVVTIGDHSRLLRLIAREDRLRINEVVAPERSLGASLSVALSRSTALEIGAGRYDGNRLLGTQAGEYVSAGIVLRFGATHEPALPRAAGSPQPRGTTRLSISAPQARSVEIAGDFNDWKPTAARRASNGVWYADLAIPPGQYRYAFRINGNEWRVPHGATAVDDGFGGTSAWLTIPGPGRS